MSQVYSARAWCSSLLKLNFLLTVIASHSYSAK